VNLNDSLNLPPFDQSLQAKIFVKLARSKYSASNIYQFTSDLRSLIKILVVIKSTQADMTFECFTRCFFWGIFFIVILGIICEVESIS